MNINAQNTVNDIFRCCGVNSLSVWVSQSHLHALMSLRCSVPGGRQIAANDVLFSVNYVLSSVLIETMMDSLMVFRSAPSSSSIVAGSTSSSSPDVFSDAGVIKEL